MVYTKAGGEDLDGLGQNPDFNPNPTQPYSSPGRAGKTAVHHVSSPNISA